RVHTYEYTPRGCKKLEETLSRAVSDLLRQCGATTIGIAGSIDGSEHPYRKLLQLLGRVLVAANYRIVSGGGQGVASEILKGITGHLQDADTGAEIGRIRTFKPVGYTMFAPPPV